MTPEITVCVATYDRPDGVRRAIDSVLTQAGPPLKVVVVNQGDPALTDQLQKEYRDDPVTVVSRPPRGLSMNRNEGLALVDTEWVAFLDDDDRLLPEWSTIMARHMAPGVALISCSTELRAASDGSLIEKVSALTPVDQIEDVTGLHLAGCFTARTEVVRGIGGFLPGLGCSHQTELWIRLTSEIRAHGQRIEADADVGSHTTRRPATDRPLSNPTLLFEGGRWLLVRHRKHLRNPPVRRANAYGAVSVHAARVGRWREARRYAFEAAMAEPLVPRRWGRLFVCCIPSLARRVWGGDESYDRTQAAQNSIHLVRTLATELPEHAEDLRFLPWGYQPNPPQSSDAAGTPFWEAGTQGNDVRFQEPVYKWAARILKAKRVSGPVLDIGCGSGHKLQAHLAPEAEVYGVDQASGIAVARKAFPDGNWIEADLETDEAWASLAEHRPGLVVCSDVIEHVNRPYELLDHIAELIGDDAMAIISTPDRDLLDDPRPYGPPGNPRHIREWSYDEFDLLLAAAGLEVVASRHFLPRRYSPTLLELKRVVWRMLHWQAIPDHQSSMAFLVRRERQR